MRRSARWVTPAGHRELEVHRDKNIYIALKTKKVNVRGKLTAEATTGCASPTPRLGEGLREGPPAAPAEPRPRGAGEPPARGGAALRAGLGRRSRAGGAEGRSLALA